MQDEATGDCLPFGGAFSYEVEEPDRYAVAKSIAADFGIPGGVIEMDTSAAELATFLESFGFDIGGLEGAIGCAGYRLARVTGQTLDVIVLYYETRSEVWTVALDCTPSSRALMAALIL